MKLHRMAGAFAAFGLVAISACSDTTQPLPTPSAGAPRASEGTTAERSGSSIVLFTTESAVPDAGVALVQSLGGVITSRHDAIGVLFVKDLSTDAVAALRASDLVAGVGPDYVLNWLPDVVIGGLVQVEDDVTTTSHDPLRASRLKSWQWGVQRIAATDAWRAGYRGKSAVKVAILDTGIDFIGRETRGLVDLNLSKSFIADEPTFDDLHLHGTHVGGTVVSNSITTAGVAPHTTLIAIKVLSRAGRGSFEGVIGGIMYASDIGSHVINMSLGAQFDKRLEGAKELIEAMRRSIKYAGQRNTLVISAAGNSSTNLDDAGAPIVALPCMVSHMCVSATGPLNGQFDTNGPILTANHDQPSYYTNYGFSAVTVAAPGGNANPADPTRSQGTWRQEDLIAGPCAQHSTVVPQCNVNNDAVAFYLFLGGTSMATPHVAGAAAMVIANAAGPISFEEVKRRLIVSADDVGPAGADIYSNNGRINVLRALQVQ